jgi:hypothetical protein
MPDRKRTRQHYVLIARARSQACAGNRVLRGRIKGADGRDPAKMAAMKAIILG